MLLKSALILNSSSYLIEIRAQDVHANHNAPNLFHSISLSIPLHSICSCFVKFPKNCTRRHIWRSDPAFTFHAEARRQYYRAGIQSQSTGWLPCNCSRPICRQINWELCWWGSGARVKGKGKGLGGSFTKPETTQIPFVPSQLESTHEGSTAGQLCSFMSSASFFLLTALLLLFLPRPLLSLPYSVSSTKKRSFHVPSSHSCTHCHSFPDSRFESRRGILRRVRRRRQSC